MASTYFPFGNSVEREGCREPKAERDRPLVVLNKEILQRGDEQRSEGCYNDFEHPPGGLRRRTAEIFPKTPRYAHGAYG